MRQKMAGRTLPSSRAALNPRRYCCCRGMSLEPLSGGIVRNTTSFTAEETERDGKREMETETERERQQNG